VRVCAKHYVRQRQNNLTTLFNFNEREIIRPTNFHDLFIYFQPIDLIVLPTNNLEEAVILKDASGQHKIDVCTTFLIFKPSLKTIVATILIKRAICPLAPHISLININ
jgi:hypothetical protein